MRLQRIHALPLLHDDEGVGAIPSLKRKGVLGVDRCAVLDAAVLGPNRGNVRAERL